jgi:predicted dehydrogenase
MLSVNQFRHFSTSSATDQDQRAPALRVIVVGLGVQGNKRRRFAGPDFVAAVDPVNREAEFRDLGAVALDRFDAALVCVPDDQKVGILEYLLAHGKHVLVEKPLIADDDSTLIRLEKLANANRAVCQVAYNHRFEPHIVSMRDLIASGGLGRIYRCRMFYGNGTARQVRESQWRDRGSGVLGDLGSHLLDTARFWFGELGEDFAVVSADCFENRAPDHVVFASRRGSPRLELEVTLVSWRNHFTADVYAENGSAHISSLCKWGPSEFTHYARVLPSGRPPEDRRTLVQEDPTWAREYQHFKTLCRERRMPGLGGDLWLGHVLRDLGQDACRMIDR